MVVAETTTWIEFFDKGLHYTNSGHLGNSSKVADTQEDFYQVQQASFSPLAKPFGISRETRTIKNPFVGAMALDRLKNML